MNDRLVTEGIPQLFDLCNLPCSQLMMSAMSGYVISLISVVTEKKYCGQRKLVAMFCIRVNNKTPKIYIKRKKRVKFDCLDWTVKGCLLTDAIPLLFNVGTIACCVSPLDQFGELRHLRVPHIDAELNTKTRSTQVNCPRNPEFKSSKHPNLQGSTTTPS